MFCLSTVWIIWVQLATFNLEHSRSELLTVKIGDFLFLLGSPSSSYSPYNMCKFFSFYHIPCTCSQFPITCVKHLPLYNCQFHLLWYSAVQWYRCTVLYFRHLVSTASHCGGSCFLSVLKIGNFYLQNSTETVVFSSTVVYCCRYVSISAPYSRWSMGHGPPRICISTERVPSCPQVLPPSPEKPFFNFILCDWSFYRHLLYKHWYNP